MSPNSAIPDLFTLVSFCSEGPMDATSAGYKRVEISVLASVFIGLMLLGLLGCDCSSRIPPVSNEENQEPPFFNDVTANSGIVFTYRNGFDTGHFGIIEQLGGGVALIDFDGDGFYDVFLLGGGYFGGKGKREIKGHPCKLYKNLGNWKFK